MPDNVRILVVDPNSRTPVDNGVVGEVWVHSPVVIAMGKNGGYHRNRKLTKNMFEARLKGSKERFLRTGGLGFWDLDHLYICGCRKDVMTNKKNTKYYPPDVEWVVEDARPEVRPGCVAAFASVGGTVEVVFEVFKSTSGEAVISVCQAVAKAVKESTGIEPSSVVAVPEGSIPKTHIGLVQRRLAKAKLLKEQMTILYDFPERRDRVSVPDLETVIQKQAIPDLQELLRSRSKKKEISFGEMHIANLHGSEMDSILSRYIGSGFDDEMSWYELGLTSTASVTMRRDLETHMYVRLAPDCLAQYPTPASLKEHIMESSGYPIMTDALYIQLSQSSHLSWGFAGLLQATLSGLIIILFCVPILPCWYAYDALQTFEAMLLLMVPLWMLTFSMLVIFSKWLVVGRYRECRIVTPRFAYLQWWFVDRLVDLWEVWVGQFIINTPLLWWFYTVMGARLDPSCELDGFIREFDLVVIGQHSALKYNSLKCRKFSSWEVFERGPLMAFRPICIGDSCVVRGLICPGSKLGNGVYVEKLSVVPEGAEVDDNVMLLGNPAFVADEKEESSNPSDPYWLPCGFFKMSWLGAELAIMYGIWIAAEYINATPETVDTTTVDYWLFFGATCILLSLLSSIVFKLVLIGRRRPGKMSQCWCYHPCDWAADYHFRLVTLPFRLFARNSRLCNVILMLHGMDIDFVSKVDMESFPPSKMDLISVHRSFIGPVPFDVESDGIFHRTIIEEASLGQFSHIRADVSIAKSIIPPLSLVTETVIEDRIKKKHRMGHSCALYGREVVTIAFDAVVLGAVLMTVAPVYYIWKLSLDILSPITIIPICAASLTAQSMSWFVVLWVVQLVTFLGVCRKKSRPWFPCLHSVYLNCSDTYQNWSFFRLVYGSPTFRTLSWLLGASFEGRIVYFGDRLYDFFHLSADPRTVLDGVTVVGHNIVFDRICFGQTRVSGLVREGTFVMMDATITRKESGPLHAIAKTSNFVQRKPTMMKPILTRIVEDV